MRSLNTITRYFSTFSTMNFRQKERNRIHGHLLKRDHTLKGGILFGLDGHVIELQARAVEVAHSPQPISQCFRITGSPNPSPS